MTIMMFLVGIVLGYFIGAIHMFRHYEKNISELMNVKLGKDK